MHEFKNLSDWEILNHSTEDTRFKILKTRESTGLMGGGTSPLIRTQPLKRLGKDVSCRQKDLNSGLKAKFAARSTLKVSTFSPGAGTSAASLPFPSTPLATSDPRAMADVPRSISVGSSCILLYDDCG